MINRWEHDLAFLTKTVVVLLPLEYAPVTTRFVDLYVTRCMRSCITRLIDQSKGHTPYTCYILFIVYPFVTLPISSHHLPLLQTNSGS